MLAIRRSAGNLVLGTRRFSPILVASDHSVSTSSERRRAMRDDRARLAARRAAAPLSQAQNTLFQRKNSAYID